MKKIAIFVVAVATITICMSSSFVVEKTKNIVKTVIVPYHEQWCEQFARFVKVSAELDAQKSVLQRNGVDDIMMLLENGETDRFVRLSNKEQAQHVDDLKKIITKIEDVTRAISAYNAKITKQSLT